MQRVGKTYWNLTKEDLPLDKGAPCSASPVPPVPGEEQSYRSCVLPNKEVCFCLPKETICLTRSSLVATLRTTRVSMIKRRRGTRQAMLLSVSLRISWVWFCWDSDVGWGFCWGSWPPCIGGSGCCWDGFGKLLLSSVWGGGCCWGSFGTVALARLSLSIFPKNVSNSESHGGEPPAWIKKCVRYWRVNSKN